MLKKRKHAGGRPSIAGVKPTQHLIAKRVAEVSELYLSGMTMMAIAKQLGVTDTTVYEDIQKARAEWRTRASDNIEKLKQNELSKIDWVEMEATKAWARSIGINIKKIRKTGYKPGDQGGDYNEEVEQEELLVGESKFLDIIAKCADQRCKILGLIAPIKNTLSNPDGSPLLTGIKVVEVGKS